MAKLIVTEGPDTGSEYDLDPQAERLTVGRDPSSEIPLNDTSVSRRHFNLVRTPHGWQVVDLGSRNQTLLNGKTVREALLNDGDLLRAGDTETRFENPGAPVHSTGILSMAKE